MLLVLIIIIIVFIVVKRLLKDQDNVENGGRDADIRQLYNYYDLVRSNIGALRSDVITIGTYLFELDGKASASSADMSVCVVEGTNDALAERLGMEVASIGNKKYYQLSIGKKFSTTEKKEMLKQLMSKLTAHYANDAFKYDGGVWIISTPAI